VFWAVLARELNNPALTLSMVQGLKHAPHPFSRKQMKKETGMRKVWMEYGGYGGYSKPLKKFFIIIIFKQKGFGNKSLTSPKLGAGRKEREVRGGLYDEVRSTLFLI
jgi:hypothetical protein